MVPPRALVGIVLLLAFASGCGGDSASDELSGALIGFCEKSCACQGKETECPDSANSDRCLGSFEYLLEGSDDCKRTAASIYNCLAGLTCEQLMTDTGPCDDQDDLLFLAQECPFL